MKRIPSLKRSLQLLVASILLANTSFTASAKSAASAPVNTPSTSARATAPPPSLEPLSVKIDGDESNRVGDPIIVWVSITNESEGQLKLMNATVRINPSSNSSFGSASSCAVSGDGEPLLMPRQMLRMACKFPDDNKGPAAALSEAADPAASQPGVEVGQGGGNSASGWSASWFTRVLDAQLRFEVEVEIEHMAGGKQDMRRFYPVVTVKAVDYSVFIGGVAGAMLLALFVLAERVLKNPEVRRHWVQSLFVTLVMGLRGGAIAVIALLLGKTTQGVGSPVSLSVTDFTGGVLIGLFSYPLASWISSTLKLDGVFVNASAETEQKEKQS